MGTNCVLLVADLFPFSYKRDFMKSLSRLNQADIIVAFNSISRYLGDVLNIYNIYFEHMVDRIYPAELQLNKANSSDTEAPFLDLNLSIYNGTVPTQIYDKRDNFDVSDFGCHNKALTSKLLRLGCHYHKLRKTFSKFYRRHSGW